MGEASDIRHPRRRRPPDVYRGTTGSTSWNAGTDYEERRVTGR
jgi:hypothetical protein